LAVGVLSVNGGAQLHLDMGFDISSPIFID